MVSNDVVQELSDVTSLADEADARRFLLEHQGVWLRRSDEVPVVPWRSKNRPTLRVNMAGYPLVL